MESSRVMAAQITSLQQMLQTLMAKAVTAEGHVQLNGADVQQIKDAVGESPAMALELAPSTPLARRPAAQRSPSETPTAGIPAGATAGQQDEEMESGNVENN